MRIPVIPILFADILGHQSQDRQYALSPTPDYVPTDIPDAQVALGVDSPAEETDLFPAASLTALTLTTGKMTHYNPSVGIGACGWQNKDSEHVVAVGAALWTTPNPNKDPLCGKTIHITYKGKTVSAKVVDKCPSASCGRNDLDVSPAVFKEFAGLGTGHLDVKWSF